MPKIIKKKVVKQEAKAEDSMRTMISFLADKAESNLKYIALAAAAVVVVIALVVGSSMYRKGTAKKAQVALYEGYKLYYGLYDAGALPKGQRLEMAMEEFRKAYEAGRSAQALMYMADVQYAQGRYGEAVESLEKLLREFPNDDIYAPLLLYKAAMAEVKAGKQEEALKYLERLDALKSGSFKDLALVEAASILEGLGRKEEAVQKYKDLLKRYPESSFAKEAEFKLGRKKPGERDGGKEGG